MMLASTVQFSRYGRYPPSTASWRGRFGPIEVTAMRPFPQDPTACSACATPGIWRSMSRVLEHTRPY